MTLIEATPATTTALSKPRIQRGSSRITWRALALWGPALLVTAAVLMPIAYLLLRTVEAGPTA